MGTAMARLSVRAAKCIPLPCSVDLTGHDSLWRYRRIPHIPQLGDERARERSKVCRQHGHAAARRRQARDGTAASMAHQTVAGTTDLDSIVNDTLASNECAGERHDVAMQ